MKGPKTLLRESSSLGMKLPKSSSEKEVKMFHILLYSRYNHLREARLFIASKSYDKMDKIKKIIFGEFDWVTLYFIGSMLLIKLLFF